MSMMEALDEKTLVNWLTNYLPSVSKSGSDEALNDFGVNVQIGADRGDDCAVIDIGNLVSMVIGTDYVRGPKFHLYEAGYLSDRDIGRYCVTANASDVAAMGAIAAGFLSVVRYPKDFSGERFREVLAGIDEGCSAYGLRLVGGDTGSAERLILSGTAFGFCAPGKALVRSSARPGDVVVVTRALGGAGAAVLASSAGVVPHLDPDKWEVLLGSWKGLNAQMQAGRALAESGCRIACQDVSDGLRSTVREISESSGVGVVLDLSSIPLFDGVEEVARAVSVDTSHSVSPEALAISASTDFCLCFTCGPEDYDRVVEELLKVDVVPHVVGVCEDGEGVWVRDDQGEKIAAPGVEWKHQSGDVASIVLNGLRSTG